MLLFDLYKNVNEEFPGEDADMPDVPQEVKSFLGNLGLLRGIPIHYLIPNEYYLPKTTEKTQITGAEITVEKGSLKLFRLDKEWIECLFDGALSVGEEEEVRKLLLAKAIAGNYVAEVFYEESKNQIIKQLQGNYTDYTPEQFKDELYKRLTENKAFAFKNKKEDANWEVESTVSQSNWNYTGFIMRSALIASWVGVEVVAKGTNSLNDISDNRPLHVVRLERLAEDTIFCMCEGFIRQIDIIQPAEGTHFTTNNADTSIEDCINMETRCLDIAKVKDKLGAAHSAAFAKKLMAQPITFRLKVEWERSSPKISFF